MKGEKGFLELIGLPDVASIGNLVLGFLGIVFLIEGNEVFFIKSIFLAGLLDGVDGFIARKQDRQSSFGVEIDSLADLVSFGVAPALFFWAKISFNDYLLFFPIFYLAIAMVRLARYNVSEDYSGFKGVPTTCSGLILVILLSFSFEYYLIINLVVISLLSLLMISSFNFPKIKAEFLFPFGLILVLSIILSDRFFLIGKLMLLSLLFIYVFTGPVIKWDFMVRN